MTLSQAVGDRPPKMPERLAYAMCLSRTFAADTVVWLIRTHGEDFVEDVKAAVAARKVTS